MPRELFRLPCSQAELVLLRYAERHFQIDVYWHGSKYYETLAQTDSLDSAQEVLAIAESLLARICQLSLYIE